ncbi:MAG TPA: hypothetical protein VNK82_05390 [Terriglobales bacterium]|nr:hypothetical protein [Terriglobales bacterium]
MEAGRLKGEIRERLGITPRMRFAGVGVLEVKVGDEVVFSRQKARRNARPGEVAELVEASIRRAGMPYRAPRDRSEGND